MKQCYSCLIYFIALETPFYFDQIDKDRFVIDQNQHAFKGFYHTYQKTKVMLIINKFRISVKVPYSIPTKAISVRIKKLILPGKCLSKNITINNNNISITNSYLSPQFKYVIFHIFIYILHFYGYITNSQSDQLPDGLIAQSVEHCTGIAEVMGSNPVQA